jgi:hypothetical protein
MEANVINDYDATSRTSPASCIHACGKSPQLTDADSVHATLFFPNDLSSSYLRNSKEITDIRIFSFVILCLKNSYGGYC